VLNDNRYIGYDGARVIGSLWNGLRIGEIVETEMQRAIREKGGNVGIEPTGGLSSAKEHQLRLPWSGKGTRRSHSFFAPKVNSR